MSRCLCAYPASTIGSPRHSHAALNATSAVVVKLVVALSYVALDSEMASIRRFVRGLSQTSAMGWQLRVGPLRRSECPALAARARAFDLCNVRN